jgi:hypothetical protein
MNGTTTKPLRPKVDLVSLVDRDNPEQRAIGFYLLKARQRRKLEAERKRGAK